MGSPQPVPPGHITDQDVPGQANPGEVIPGQPFPGPTRPGQQIHGQPKLGGGSAGTSSPLQRKKEVPLPEAIAHWHTSAPSPLRGTIKLKDEDIPLEGYSWMCGLLPHLGYQELYEKFKFDETWQRDPNRSLAYTIIPEFLNPADPRQRAEDFRYLNLGLTHFVGMSGVEDARNVVAASLPRSDPRAGVFGYDEIASPSQITDGTSQTVMLVGAGENLLPWVQGGGATIRGVRDKCFDRLTGFGTRGLREPGALVMMADGSARVVSAKIDPGVFRALCTIHGAESVDIGQLGPAAKFPGPPPGQ
jgi:hypothetical protein